MPARPKNTGIWECEYNCSTQLLNVSPRMVNNTQMDTPHYENKLMYHLYRYVLYMFFGGVLYYVYSCCFTFKTGLY